MMFLEEVFSLVTLQMYLATTAEFLRHEKDIYYTEVPRYISESQEHHTVEKKPLQEI
jgi:hypothetical protein